MSSDTINLDRVFRRTPWSRLRTFLLKRAGIIFAVLRWWGPAVKAPFVVPGSKRRPSRVPALLRGLFLWIVDPARYVVVTHFDYVQEVLSRDEDFDVPYGAKGDELGWDPYFVIALPGDEHDAARAELKKFFRLIRFEDLDLIELQARCFAHQQLDDDGNETDVVERLLGRVPTLIMERYWGIGPVENRRLFEDCQIVISAYFFGEPNAKVEGLEYVKTASEISKAVYNEAVDRTVREVVAGGDERDDVLYRMVRSELKNGELPQRAHKQIVTHLWGMGLGFMPTCLLASGNMLEVLLENPDMMRQARCAALQDDDDLLCRCLLEANRYRPINPGPWRFSPPDREVVLGKDTAWPVRIPPGSTVWASTQSAMFDAARVTSPEKFDPDRDPDEYMLFSYGIHNCVARAIAERQITQTIKALLIRNARPAPGTRFVRSSYFPRQFKMRYDPRPV